MTDAQCFKCRGTIKAVQDVDGGYVGTCMSCGAIQPYEAVNDLQPEERGALGRPPSDWIAAAKSRMNTLLREIQAMDNKRAEVEGIQRALSAYGEKNIPVVPWKVSKATSPASITNARGEQRPWTDDEPRLIEMAQQGASNADIAAALGRSMPSVNTRISDLRARGVSIPRRNERAA